MLKSIAPRRYHHNHLVTSIIKDAEKLTENGNFNTSNSILSRLNPTVISTTNDIEYLNSHKAILNARNYFHLDQNEKTIASLNSIPANILNSSKEISSSHYLISGMIFRRIAHSLWKQGKIQEAKSFVHKAIDCFQACQYEAEIGYIQLTKYNAEINETYTNNLLLHIEGIDNFTNESLELIKKAIVCESNIIKNTPPVLCDDMIGLTMIVDMAYGIGKVQNDLFSTSNNIEFKKAFVDIFQKHSSLSWSHLLLEESKTKKPHIRARYLILAAKISTIENDSTDLIIQMLDVLYILQKESQQETKTTSYLRFFLRELNLKQSSPINIRIFR